MPNINEFWLAKQPAARELQSAQIAIGEPVNRDAAVSLILAGLAVLTENPDEVSSDISTTRLQDRLRQAPESFTSVSEAAEHPLGRVSFHALLEGITRALSAALVLAPHNHELDNRLMDRETVQSQQPAIQDALHQCEAALRQVGITQHTAFALTSAHFLHAARTQGETEETTLAAVNRQLLDLLIEMERSY